MSNRNAIISAATAVSVIDGVAASLVSLALGGRAAIGIAVAAIAMPVSLLALSCCSVAGD